MYPDYNQFMEVQEVKPEVARNHPLRDPQMHERLLKYCYDRIDYGVYSQNVMRTRYENIDRELSGFVQLTEDDRKRRRENLRGKAPKPIESKPEFVLTQLTRGVAYLASVFSPNTDLFKAITTPDKQQIANAFVELMNDHSVKYKYFRQQSLFFLNALKYNLGGMRVEWEEVFGNTIESGGAGAITRLKNTKVYEGNKLTSVDMYNTFWDPSCHPINAHFDAEYVGEIFMRTPFQIRRMVENGQIYNWSQYAEKLSYRRGSPWFRNIPMVRFNDYTDGSRPDGTYNWAHILSLGTAGTGTMDEIGGYELVRLYIRLLPDKFGLVPPQRAGAPDARNKFEIWRITILNGQQIVNCEYINNIHDMIPYVFAQPNEDNLGLQAKSHGERLAPFQDLGAFMMNTYTAGMRRNIWDLLVYDPTIVNLKTIGDDVAARVPMESTGYGKDPNKSIWHYNAQLQVEKNLQNLQAVIELMEFFFPTKQLQNQVADIDRATVNQAAAVIQANQRELWAMARKIDDQSMSTARSQMHSNIIQYQQKLTIRLPGGQTIEVDAAKFREAKIDLRLGESLRDVDLQQRKEYIKELINTLLQTQAMSEFDMVALVDYLSTLCGVDADLTQFRRTTPPVAIQGKPGANGTGQQQQVPVPNAAGANGGMQ